MMTKKIIFTAAMMFVVILGFSQQPVTIYTIVKTDTCGTNCIAFSLRSTLPHDPIKIMRGWLYYEDEPSTQYLYNQAMAKYGRFDTATYCPSGIRLVLKGNYLLAPKYSFRVKKW